MLFPESTKYLRTFLFRTLIHTYLHNFNAVAMMSNTCRYAYDPGNMFIDLFDIFLAPLS